MSRKNENFRYPSYPSLNSFRSLQKLKEIFCKEPVNCENSIEKLFADSRFSLQDEPINSEFFTYYAVQSNSDFKKSNDIKSSDAQSRILELLKNCKFPKHIFGSCQETKTENKACMCKPLEKRNKTEIERKHGLIEESITDKNNYFYKTNENAFDSREAKNIGLEEAPNKSNRKIKSTTRFKSGDFDLIGSDMPGKHIKVRDSTEKSKKESPIITSNNNRNANTSLVNKFESEKKKSLKENAKSLDSITSKKAREKTGDQNGTIPLEMKSSQLPKIVLHLPVDFTQFGQQSTGNDLKLVLCGNQKKQCNCESCGFNQTPIESKDHKKKKKSKASKIDSDNDKIPKKEESKKKKFTCFKFCRRKSKSKQNQTEYSEESGNEHQKVNTVGKKKSKNVAKCCRCNKYNPECPMSGEQIDTLKLLIKMEAKQNYRQINHILKELNEQQEDIRKLRETHTRIVQYFPEIFDKKNAQGDHLSNEELKENVKSLFKMYKELSVKINEIHKLSKDIIGSNGEILHNRHSYERPLSDKTLSVKSPVEDLSESSTSTKTEDNNFRPISKLTDVPIPKKDEMSNYTDLSVTNYPKYVDEFPEKLTKSERTTAKKPTCPCEINSGIYIRL